VPKDKLRPSSSLPGPDKDQAIHAEEKEGESNPYDTHPPLRERVAALRDLSQGTEGDTRPAMTGRVTVEQWRTRCVELGIDALPLGDGGAA
jgi:hypothetical protein